MAIKNGARERVWDRSSLVQIENLEFIFIVSIVEEDLIWRSSFNHESDGVIQTQELPSFHIVFRPDPLDFIFL